VKTFPAIQANAQPEMGALLKSLKHTGYGGWKNPANSRVSAALMQFCSSKFLYSPITAADEKIPLSMVRVNKKPQHIVFCLHSPHQFSKSRHLPVESSKSH
jgi:hypothetical protein